MQYIDFIKNNKYLTLCQKKEFLNPEKNIFYVNNKSNNQIITYINQTNKSKKLSKTIRLYLLFNHFLKHDFVNELIDKIKNENYSDIQAYKYVISHPEAHEKKKTTSSYAPCSQYTYTFEKISLVLYNKFLNSEKNPIWFIWM